VRDRLWTAATVAALVAFVAWSAWQRWLALTVSPFPLGVDGYFYPVQLRSLLEHGTLQYPSSPLTFWWMAPFAAATDPITGAKLGAALGCALAIVPAYAIVRALTDRRSAGLVAAAVIASSATSAYVTMEFVKQGVGLTVALAALWLLLRALSSPSRARIVAAALGVLATALAHKLAAGCVLAIAIPAAIEAARARGLLRGRRLLYATVLAVIAGLALLLAGLVAPQRFLSPGDLALVSSLVTTHAHWGDPALATPHLTLAFDHEAAIAGIVAVLAAVALVTRRGLAPSTSRSTRIVAWGAVIFGLVIAIPWLDVSDPQGLAFRLRAGAFVPLALCTALVASALAGIVKRPEVLVAIAVLLVVRAAPRDRSEGRVLPHPAMVSAVMAATTHIPPGTTVIVPERHILFMVAWYTRAPVALRPESITYGRRVRLLPLSFIGMGSPLDEALDAARRDPTVVEPPLGLHPRHRNGLVLVAEPTWDWLMAALPADVRGYWSRWRTI
jgi:hypothetical protein